MSSAWCQKEGGIRTVTLPTSMSRNVSHIWNGKLYIPGHSGDILEIFDLQTETGRTVTLLTNVGRYGSQIWNGKLYMPQNWGTALEIVDLQLI